ncbi:uncharacterized protein M6B38_103205 [Iris pallida]|uniref:Uncharacterized protein n=1 Tax=Iris pallida TaxID=29817 RepID=A0AAX6FCN0_IRIPA|nr:uncharacterized protein M6B38_103205 [Iris pallida]
MAEPPVPQLGRRITDCVHLLCPLCAPLHIVETGLLASSGNHHRTSGKLPLTISEETEESLIIQPSNRHQVETDIRDMTNIFENKNCTRLRPQMHISNDNRL